MLTRFFLLPFVSALLMFGSEQAANDIPQDRALKFPPAPLEREIEKHFFGLTGSRYYPVSRLEGAGKGNVLVALGTEFETPFESCSMPLADGTTAPLVCAQAVNHSTNSTPCVDDRGIQIWRASFRCSSVAELKVTCKRNDREIVFTVHDGLEDKVCSFFG